MRIDFMAFPMPFIAILFFESLGAKFLKFCLKIFQELTSFSGPVFAKRF
jgi:hypothetical protein